MWAIRGSTPALIRTGTATAWTMTYAATPGTPSPNSGHDHDKEPGKIYIIILQKRQNKVAHVESHGCQCDCTDNDADDDAAHPYGNGAPRPLNNSGNNLISCHSCFFTEPACRHSDKNGNNGCIKRRESRKHQPDKAHQGKDKMSLLFITDNASGIFSLAIPESPNRFASK